MTAKVRIIILTVLCASFIVSTHSTELVDVREVIPDIVLDIRYATPDNFTGKVLYPSPDCFLAKEVAVALKKVQEELKLYGYRLKIFDGYRPLSVQKELWKVFPDSRYVANPEKGSVHNRGYAVDLTLIYLDGSPVQMPTDFDEFTEKAYTNYKNLSPEAIKHRELLKKTMERYGFISIKTEWWHFNYRNYKDKPILDIPFEKIRRETY